MKIDIPEDVPARFDCQLLNYWWPTNDLIQFPWTCKSCKSASLINEYFIWFDGSSISTLDFGMHLLLHLLPTALHDFSTVFLKSISDLYFSNAFHKCISQQQQLGFGMHLQCIVLLSQMYFSNVFLKCIFQMYFWTVFLKCIDKLYSQMYFSGCSTLQCFAPSRFLGSLNTRQIISD